MRSSALFDAKNFGFSKFMVCRMDKVEEIELVRCGKWRGCQIFRFCADIFYARPLTLYNIHNKTKKIFFWRIWYARVSQSMKTESFYLNKIFLH